MRYTVPNGLNAAGTALGEIFFNFLVALICTGLLALYRTCNGIARHTNHVRRVDLCVLEKFCRLKTVPQPSAHAALVPPAAVVP